MSKLKQEEFLNGLLALLKRTAIGFVLGVAIAGLAMGFSLMQPARDEDLILVVFSVTILVAIYPYVFDILKGKK